MDQKPDSRARMFELILSEDDIDMEKLRQFSKLGCPSSDIRPLCWMVLLEYLPHKKCNREGELLRKRSQYSQFLHDFVSIDLTRGHLVVDDPLGATGEGTLWDDYFRDNEVLAQIDKDSRRLLPDLAFFQSVSTTLRPSNVQVLHERVNAGALKAEVVSPLRPGAIKVANDHQVAAKNSEFHWEVIERILFVFAKLNPGIGYVQGMNEVLGPIYYTLASSPQWALHAEADSFFCFSSLMGDYRDNFIKTLDDSEMGIGAQLRRLTIKLRAVDEALAQHLAALNLNPQFYAFRWLTLLFSQDFSLPDVIDLWDALFACPSTSRPEYSICIAVALLVLARDKILPNDFGDNMQLLQNYPQTDVRAVIAKADELSSLGHQRKTSVTKALLLQDPKHSAEQAPQLATPSQASAKKPKDEGSGNKGDQKKIKA